MKKHGFGLSKRMVAMLLCFVMLLAVLPLQGGKVAAAEASGKTYTVIAGSDFQYSNADHGIAGGHVRDILATIKSQGLESADGFLFCGDYSQGFTTTDTTNGVTHLKNVISEELPTLSDDHKFFLQGNHDPDVLTTDGTLTPSGGYETEGYSVFLINEKDYMWYNDTESAIKTTAANLRSFLNAKTRSGYTKPIFVMSHIQLHYSMRTYGSGDGKYADYLFDVLNEAAGNGLNIIFLFGHNHSNGWDDYLGGSAIYLAKGDSILIAQGSTTEFKQQTLNFTYMNAGYVGYYGAVNTGAETDLNMSVFRITDDQVTISRYTSKGIHDVKSMGVTNAYQNETAYGPDTRVLPSPQQVVLNKDVQAAAISGAKVTGDGITSFEVLVAASQLPQGYSAYQTYQISAEGYVDGNPVTVTLPIDSCFDSNRPALVLDHARGKTIPLLISNDSVTFTADHLGSFTVAQSNASAVTSSQTISSYFKTVPQGGYIQEGVPYVITDSGLDKASHWVLTGNTITKNVSGVANTGLALEEIANADTSPVWYVDGDNLRFGAADGPYLNIDHTGDYNGDSTVALVTVGDYNAATTAKIKQFATGPSYYMGAGTSDAPLYLAHRNSGTDSIAATYAKYNYNVSLWYFNEVISSAKLTVVPSQNIVTLKNTALLAPTVIAGTRTVTDYTITWESGDPSVATVSSNGEVTPVKPGQVFIKATLTTLEGNAVEGVSVELPITVVSYSKTDSSVTTWTDFLHQRGEQESPVAGGTYIIGFYVGGWYLTGNILHQGDAGYNGLNGVEGLEIAATASVPEDIWYYDGTHLYSGTQPDPNKCMIYENGMVTIGPVTANNEAFVVDKSSYEFWPYLSVSAGKINHFGGLSYNVASLYNNNNYMCFYKTIPDQKVSLDVKPTKDTLYAGETLSLTPAVKVNDTNTNTYKIMWTSSDLCVATVDGQGIVKAVSGGTAIITATLVSVNNGETTEALSVEIPVHVVKERETESNVTSEVMLDRSLQRTTVLESGKPYVISSAISNYWVMTDRFKGSDNNTAYTGPALEHFDLSGGEDVWYYIEQEVDGVTKQYLRFGSPDAEGNYLICDNRHAKLGTVDQLPFDSVVLNESLGGFKISYAATARHLHQLGGPAFDAAIPTSHYGNEIGSYWHFNTILPGGLLKLTLDKPTADFHADRAGELPNTLTLDGVAVTDYKLAWACADSGIATVAEGKVTGIAPGSTVITASVTEVNGKRLDVALTVDVPVSVEDHSWSDATCTTVKTCLICGATEGDVAGHRYEAVATAPSCTQSGFTTYTCSVCGDSYIGDWVAATGHKYESVVTAPTCTDKGYTTYTCHCGDKYTTDEVAALGHKYNAVITTAPGCESAGVKTFTCQTCGDKYTEPLAATGHKYTAKVTAPTCTEKGYTTYSCACGHSYKADEKAALGHSYKTVTVDATCTENGSVTGTCAVCGDTKIEVIPATGHSFDVTVVAPDCVIPGYSAHNCKLCGYNYYDNVVPAKGHNYEAVVTAPTYTSSGYTTFTCASCGHSYKDLVTKPIGHDYTVTVYNATCTTGGYTLYTCACGMSYTENETEALGHSFENGICITCGEADPDNQPQVVNPTLALKVPTLEFKDMITVNVMFTAENIDDVVEMGMLTYKEKVTSWSIETAEHVIPGTTYDVNTGRYIAHSQGIHAKYLGDSVYMTVYAKLTDGSYVYCDKIAPYSPVQYATNQLNKSTDMKLKQLCAAMLNYGAEAQLFFGHNTDNLANASLTAEQKALPEAYNVEMTGSVPAASLEKQGAFANNKGFAKRTPSISFEGAFCINYFFTPAYAPVDGITMYYWTVSDYNAVDVLTAQNASGSFQMEGQGVGQYRGDIVGIAAKALSEPVYVAAVYSDGTTTWTSGVLGYSIGSYCASQISKGADVAGLAEATAVYGYHAKQFFGL